jgi:cysteine desulfurase
MLDAHAHGAPGPRGGPAPAPSEAAAVYLDGNGSTPVDPEVEAACRAWFASGYGNASASHPDGALAKRAIERAREQVAAGLGAAPDEIWFTSGGTESNNWALQGARPRGRTGHLVVSAIEHKSVLKTAEALREDGHSVTVVRAHPDGAVRVAEVAAALRSDTFAVAVMLANNETGVLQPAREIAALCRARGVLSHCDAVAAVGKVPVDVRELGCDTLSVSAHKLYAPKGCGVLFVRRGVALRPLIHGCGQQCGMRSGTENTPGAVALGRAFERLREGAFRAVESTALRDALARGIAAIDPAARINGDGPRLPNTLSVSFPGVDGAELQAELGRRGVSCTAGAAASGGAASHVLLGMGLSEERARSTLRFSLCAGTTASHVERALDALEHALAALRGVPGPA